MQIKSFLNNSEFRTGIDEKSSINPLLVSGIMALSYIIIISLYIWVSGKYAAEIASSQDNLEHIELIKGLLFALVTGALLLISLYIIFHKIKRRDEIIIAQNKSIISSEGLVISGLFSSSVCHDINNILTVIIGDSELLRISDNIPPKERSYIDGIFNASQNLKKLSQGMMEAGKGYVPDQKDFVDLTLIIIDTINFARVHNKIKGCNVNYELPVELKMSLNSLLFSRTLMNLILNAAEATGKPGEILVKLKRQDEVVTLEVHDNGPGIPDEIKNNILNPFFTTKKDGTGLGLLSLKIFLEQHNGTIDIRKSELGGACFSISFQGALPSK
jgi:signal transduction histidine kinase